MKEGEVVVVRQEPERQLQAGRRRESVRGVRGGRLKGG